LFAAGNELMDTYVKLLIAWALAIISVILRALLDSPLTQLIGTGGSLNLREVFFLGAGFFFVFGSALTVILLRSDMVQTWLATRRIRNLHDLEEAYNCPFAGSLPETYTPIEQMRDTQSAVFEAMSSITDRIMNDLSKIPPRQISLCPISRQTV
jgi:hypothetical protein